MTPEVSALLDEVLQQYEVIKQEREYQRSIQMHDAPTNSYRSRVREAGAMRQLIACVGVLKEKLDEGKE